MKQGDLVSAAVWNFTIKNLIAVQNDLLLIDHILVYSDNVDTVSRRENIWKKEIGLCVLKLQQDQLV